MKKICLEDLEYIFNKFDNSPMQVIDNIHGTVTIGKIFPENYSEFRNIEISIGLNVLNSYKKYFIGNEYFIKKVIYVSGKLDEMVEFCKKIEKLNDEIKDLSKDELIRLNNEGKEIIWIMDEDK